jgi:segregation and condensation protein A
LVLEQLEYKIKLPTFEGPFDLLFHLIKKAEVDIWSISIADITDQYLAYLQSMKELNLDIASEFLVMAATLLRLKSKLLLPRPLSDGEQEEEDELFEIHSAEELFQRLEEYRFFKEIARQLQHHEAEQQKIYLRSTGGQKVMVFTQQDSVYTIWEGANHLSDIMNHFAELSRADQYVPIFNAVEDFIVADKASYIEKVLASSKKSQPLESFITGSGLWEVIITFIALLEMARQKKIILLQEKLFGPIFALIREDCQTKDKDDGQS